MAQQLHKRFSTQEAKMLLEKYLNEKVKLVYILEILKIKRSRFFELLKQFKSDPDDLSIQVEVAKQFLLHWKVKIMEVEEYYCFWKISLYPCLTMLLATMIVAITAMMVTTTA